MSFNDKVVLVTGASSGIGAVTAISFSKEGANVAMVGRNEAKLKAVAEKCAAAGNKPLVIKADVGNDDEVKRIVKETVDRYGKIDILVNNAGISELGSILDGRAVESYDKTMKVNIRAVINLTSEAVPYIVKSKGNIINVSSIAAHTMPASPTRLIYSVSKAALDHFSKGIALELSSSGVRVNTVSPGPVVTDFLDNNGYSVSWDFAKDYTALKRLSQPEEIANMIMYLASDKAQGITGSTIVIDNGYSLKNA